MSPNPHAARPRPARSLPPWPIYRDRAQAGLLLGQALESSRHLAPLVLGLSRDGLPVAREVAVYLDAPLDALVAHPLTLPGSPKVEVAAFADGGGVYLEPSLWTLPPAQRDRLDEAALELVAEISARSRIERGGRPLPPVEGRRVILVGDGLATGIAMAAAADTLRRRGARAIIGAAPVATITALARLQGLLDEVVCPVAVDALPSVAACYADGHPVTDLEALALLSSVPSGAPAAQEHAAH